MLDGEEMVGIPGGSSGSGAMSGGAECIELLELERRMPRARGSDIRELATNICRQYIRSSSRYHLLDHLKDIGKLLSWLGQRSCHGDDIDSVKKSLYTFCFTIPSSRI